MFIKNYKHARELTELIPKSSVLDRMVTHTYSHNATKIRHAMTFCSYAVVEKFPGELVGYVKAKLIALILRVLRFYD